MHTRKSSSTQYIHSTEMIIKLRKGFLILQMHKNENLQKFRGLDITDCIRKYVQLLSKVVHSTY